MPILLSKAIYNIKEFFSVSITWSRIGTCNTSCSDSARASEAHVVDPGVGYSDEGPFAFETVERMELIFVVNVSSCAEHELFCGTFFA